MKKLVVAAATSALVVGGVALPTAAGAAAGHHAAHAKHQTVKNAPCTGLGIDLALGSQNICIPL